MEDYIRKAFKSLEDFKVEIEPVATSVLKEYVEEENEISNDLTLGELFERESSYIVTHDFDYAGHDYSLFLEALCDGDSCDIEFEEFDPANINGVIVEVLDSEHEFLGSLTGEDITIGTSLGDVISKSHALISGEEGLESPESEEEDANERVFINGDPEMEDEETIEIKTEPEEEVHEEVLNESEHLNLQNEEEVKKADKVLKQDAGEAIEQIVDASAESKEDLKKTYVGSIILQCPTCKAMMYKDPDQLVKVEGEEELYNIDEECPHCGAKDGFEIVGQVASLEVDPEAEPVPPMVEEEPKPEPAPEEPEVEVEEDEVVELNPEVKEDLDKPEEESDEGKPDEESEEKEDDEVEDKEEEAEDEEKKEESEEQPLNEEHCEIKLTTEEKNMLDKLTHGNKMDAWFWIDDETDEIKDLEDGEKVLDTCDAILTIADGTDNIEAFLNEEEIKLFNDLVERCKACRGLAEESCEESCDSEKCEESCEEGKCDESVIKASLKPGYIVKIKDKGDALYEITDISVIDGVEMYNLVNIKDENDTFGDEPVDDNEVVLVSKDKNSLGKENSKEEEIKLKSFDEDKFDKLVTRYLKETYSNVKSYKTIKAGLSDESNKVVMEGLITFKSEKQKPTKFVFEAKELNAKKQLKLVGINEMFSTNKAFTLLGTVDNNKLLSESLSYRYEVGGKKVRGKAESFRKR